MTRREVLLAGSGALALDLHAELDGAARGPRKERSSDHPHRG